MLLCASPEFSWDEVYRLPYMADSWRSLWGGYRVSHGPMEVYLAKLGQEMLPVWAGSFEFARAYSSASGLHGRWVLVLDAQGHFQNIARGGTRRLQLVAVQCHPP